MNNIDWMSNRIFTRPDNSYVITYGGNPYHVPPAMPEFADIWAAVDAYAAEHPEQVEPEPGPPEPTRDEARAAKMAEIAHSYDTALKATLTMPAATPSEAEAATQAALFAAADPEGLADVLGILATRRAALEAQATAAHSVAEVQALRVTYPV